MFEKIVARLLTAILFYVAISWVLAPTKEAFRLLDTGNRIDDVKFSVWGQGTYVLNDRGAFCKGEYWLYECRGVNIGRKVNELGDGDVWEDSILLRLLTSISLPFGE